MQIKRIIAGLLSVSLVFSSAIAFVSAEAKLPGTDVVEAFNPDEISMAVNKFFEEDKKAEFEANVKDEEYKFSWDRMNEVVDRISKRIKGNK
mgnify:CR=1 FL=1